MHVFKKLKFVFGGSMLAAALCVPTIFSIAEIKTFFINDPQIKYETENEPKINEAALDFPTNEQPRVPVTMNGVDKNIQRIEVGNILHYSSFDNKYLDIFLHTSMVTNITLQEVNGVLRRTWSITEALIGGVQITQYDDKEFYDMLTQHSVSVLTPKKFVYIQNKWNPEGVWTWEYPSIDVRKEMAARMESKEGRDYQITADKSDDDWYCSELVWYATDIYGFAVPNIFETYDSEWILPIQIYNSPYSEVVWEF